MSGYFKIFIKLTDEELKEDKEYFLLIKKYTYSFLKTFIDDINIKNIFPSEKEMDNYIKNKIISDINGNKINQWMDYLFKGFGISYSKLNKAQKYI